MKTSDKFLFQLITGISALVIVLVILLNKKVFPPPPAAPSFTYFLPKLNAFINATCFILLIVSLFFIRAGNIKLHKKINISAFLLSCVFLMSYVLFHYLAPETRYGDLDGDGELSLAEIQAAGLMRYIYYVILISHIVLAAVALPLVLLSFLRGIQMRIDLHKKLVRWAFPIWLYVTFSGVVVYLMIAPFYKH